MSHTVRTFEERHPDNDNKVVDYRDLLMLVEQHTLLVRERVAFEKMGRKLYRLLAQTVGKGTVEQIAGISLVVEAAIEDTVFACARLDELLDKFNARRAELEALHASAPAEEPDAVSWEDPEGEPVEKPFNEPGMLGTRPKRPHGMHSKED